MDTAGKESNSGGKKNNTGEEGKKEKL